MGANLHARHAVQPDAVLPHGTDPANFAGWRPALLDTDCRTHQCGGEYLFLDQFDLESGYNPLAGIRGEIFDVRAQFSSGSAQSISFVLGGVAMTYFPATQQITCNGITQTLPPVNGTVNLEVITDRQSVEIFGNAGQLYMPIGSTSYSPTNNLLSLDEPGRVHGVKVPGRQQT